MSVSPPCPVGGPYKAFEAQIQTTSWARAIDSDGCIYIRGPHVRQMTSGET